MSLVRSCRMLEVFASRLPRITALSVWHSIFQLHHSWTTCSIIRSIYEHLVSTEFENCHTPQLLSESNDTHQHLELGRTRQERTLLNFICPRISSKFYNHGTPLDLLLIPFKHITQFYTTSSRKWHLRTFFPTSSVPSYPVCVF